MKMSEDSKSRGISRRKFLKGMGTGVIGGAVLPQALKGESSKTKEESGAAAQTGKNLVPLLLKVNGKPVRIEVEARTTLVQVLRDHLQLMGTKVACNQGECGSCTVLLDGKAVYSCHMLALDAAGKEVVTIEGLMKGEEINPVQEAFIEEDGLQCGFCTPGQIMAATALLKKYPKPTVLQVEEGMSGNLCRCAAYPNIIKSVMTAAEKMS
jgi:xanthine dehydrogenase YagT iron-sulfur-binding subunit